MEIKLKDKYCIITPLAMTMDGRECLRLSDELKTHCNDNIGINLDCVENCTIEFVETIKRYKTSLFNINSDIFSLLIAMNLDKTVELYTTEEDFMNKRRRILNRQFTLV